KRRGHPRPALVLLGFGGGFEEDDVGGAGAAGDGEGFAVVGPGVGRGEAGSEVGELLGWAAGDGLAPDVADAVARYDVVDGLAIGSPNGSIAATDHELEGVSRITALDGDSAEVEGTR